MTDKGIAHIGIGHAKGDDKAIEAVKQAVASPLLETTIEGASHVIINISGDISLIEANDAASYVQELAGDDANIIFGAMYDENAQDEATITVIATGLDASAKTTPVSSAMNSLGATAQASHNTIPVFLQNKVDAGAQTVAQQTAATRPAQNVGPQIGMGTTQNAGPQIGFGNPQSAGPQIGMGNQQNAARPVYRPINHDNQINIPDFLKKNKR